MKNRLTYHHTRLACYLASMTQAVVCTFAPLLFVSFQREFHLSLEQVTLLITVNFLVQLITDALCAPVVDKIGHRICIVTGHLCACLGIASMAVLPYLMPSPLMGLLTSVVIFAFGGGIIEVLASPIQEACPSDNKEASMSFMHSFYSWGSMAVAAVSTGLFALFGRENWQYVCLFWAVLPLCNAIFFTQVPLAKIVEEGKSMTVGQLLKSGLFWVLLMLMLFAGAAETVISQWASAFAETGLGVSKAVADLAGPCLFALFMGLGRILHVKLSKKINMERYLMLSALLCIAGYGLVVLPQNPVINLLGCGVSGFGVSVLWPGSLSLAANQCPRGGTAMFALLALGGDVGCGVGPTMTGFVSGQFGDNLKTGIAAAVIFPALLVVFVLFLRRKPATNP